MFKAFLFWGCCIILYLLTYSQLYTHLVPTCEFMHVNLCTCVTTCHHLATFYLCLHSTLSLSLLCLCLDSNPATSPSIFIYTLMRGIIQVITMAIMYSIILISHNTTNTPIPSQNRKTRRVSHIRPLLHVSATLWKILPPLIHM